MAEGRTVTALWTTMLPLVLREPVAERGPEVVRVAGEATLMFPAAVNVMGRAVEMEASMYSVGDNSTCDH